VRFGPVDFGPGVRLRAGDMLAPECLGSWSPGNADADIDILESARFALLINHDDGEREFGPANTDSRPVWAKMCSGLPGPRFSLPRISLDVSMCWGHPGRRSVPLAVVRCAQVRTALHHPAGDRDPLQRRVIVVVQALLGHATSGAISPEPVPRRRGLTTRTGIAHARDEESVPKLVAARFVDAGGEAGRLAHVGQRNSGHCQRVEYLSGTCSSASQMLVPHPVRAGEIIAECRRRCGLSWFAAGMPAVRARRLISRHTVGSPRRPPSRLRKTGPVARPAR